MTSQIRKTSKLKVMSISSNLKIYMKIILITIIILPLVIILMDIFFLDRKLPIFPNAKYISELDIIITKPNYCKYFDYEFYQVPFKKVGKKSYLVITDEYGCRVGSKNNVYGNNNNIVILGDSFSFGAHADYSKTIAGLLQENFKRLYILNFSVGGASSFSYGNILNYYLQKKQIRPTMLIIGLYVDMQIGDLPRVLARKRFGTFKTFNDYLVSPSLYKSLKNSYLKQAVFYAEIFLRRNTSLINVIFPKKINSEFAISLKPTLNRKEFSFLEDLLLSNVHNIQRKSSLKPNDMIIYFVPSSHELNHKIYNNHENNNFFNLSKLFWDDIKNKLQQAGFHVVDPRNAIDQLYLDKNIYPFTVDGHLNEQGFKIIFDSISEEIYKGCQAQAIPGDKQRRRGSKNIDFAWGE